MSKSYTVRVPVREGKRQQCLYTVISLVQAICTQVQSNRLVMCRSSEFQTIRLRLEFVLTRKYTAIFHPVNNGQVPFFAAELRLDQAAIAQVPDADFLFISNGDEIHIVWGDVQKLVTAPL